MLVPGFGAPGAAPQQRPHASQGLERRTAVSELVVMFAALDPADVQRKIGELRIVEGWAGR